MTSPKIEAAARDAYGWIPKRLTSDQEVSLDGFIQGYLAGHASRDEEVKALEEELVGWHDSANQAATETCGPSDEDHCTCVGVLRHEVATLRAKLEAAKTSGKLADIALSLAHEFEVAVTSREPVSGMSVPPSGDFISCAQLPSAVGMMRWWAREIRKAQAALSEPKP